MIKTEIEKVGQEFVDEPVFVLVSRPKAIAVAIAVLIGGNIPKSIEVISHYNRVALRWLTPDANGSLVAMR